MEEHKKCYLNRKDFSDKAEALHILVDARTAQLESPDFNSHTDLKLIQNLEHKK